MREWASSVRLSGSTRVRIAIFALLALGSLGLKAAVGPPRDGLLDRDPRRFDRAAIALLRSQNFSTSIRTFAYRSDLIMAERGDCRIAVRDATLGSGMAAVFAEDTKTIGPVQYFYRGQRYSRPPGLRLRAGRLEFEILDRLGARSPKPSLSAFAASPSCGAGSFGFDDVRI